MSYDEERHIQHDTNQGVWIVIEVLISWEREDKVSFISRDLQHMAGYPLKIVVGSARK
jgi:hypothetical protein